MRRMTLPKVSRRSVLAAGAASAVGLALPRRAGAAKAALKVGLLLPRSGFLALIGQACQRGAEVMVPLLADKGHAVELISADTESNAEVGRNQAERLIREGAHMLMGCFDSATTAAVAQVAEAKGIPFLINVAGDPKITEQGYKFVFRNFATAPTLVASGLKLYKEIFRISGVTPKTAVLMHTNDAFGMAFAGGINALMPKLEMPFQIVETVSYDPKARDLSIEVSKAKASNAELAILLPRQNDGMLLVREFVKQRFEPMAVTCPGSSGIYEKQFIKSLGKYAEQSITNAPWINPRQKLGGAFEQAWDKLYPEDTADPPVAATAEALLIAADAHARAGSTAPGELTAALRATNLSERIMQGGAIRFGENGQSQSNDSVTIQVLDGRARVVLPGEVAEAKLVFPTVPFGKRG